MLQKPVTDEDGRPVLKDDGTPKTQNIPVLKCFSVFHLDQCEGIKARWADRLPEVPAEPIQAAEAVLMDYISREGIRFEADIERRCLREQLIKKKRLPVRCR